MRFLLPSDLIELRAGATRPQRRRTFSPIEICKWKRDYGRCAAGRNAP